MQQQGIEDVVELGLERWRTSSRAEHVYETLLGSIQNGEYEGGRRVREEEVASTLGVSRTPVREALSRLQSRGLLEFAPSGGLIVTKLTRPRTVELYAVREILEGSAARFAAQHASEAEILALGQISDVFVETTDPVKLARLNRQFHLAIHEAAHNRYLTRTLNEFDDTLALLPGTTFEVPERHELAVAEHAQIVDAIRNRDPDEAERAARFHIRQAQDARLAMLFSYT